MSQQQNTGKIYDGQIANKSFENVIKFKYLGLTLTTSYSQENEVKGKGNVPCASTKTLTCSRATAPLILDLGCILDGGKGSTSRRDQFTSDAH